jgi:Zn-dependent protease/predicted transcriptional regulator
MKWSLKLGRFLGIDVYLHFTFLLLLAFIGFAHWLAERNIQSALAGVAFFSLLFLCVLLHEYGHALMARRFGVATRHITLLPIGGLAQLERMPDEPRQELWIALAGPAVNVGIAALLAVWLTVTGSWQPVGELSTTGGGLIERLLAVNLLLVGFNLLPAFPMDGGRVLRALLATRLSHARATGIAATIGQGMAVLFGLAGLFGTNPMLLFIALFVWIGASQEATAAEMKSSLSSVRVGEVMLTDFRSLAPESTLADATRALLAGTQQDFPVVDAGRVVGVLSRADFLAALQERGQHTPVSAVMRRDCGTISSAALLDEAFRHVHEDSGCTLPVVDGGRLVGLLTAENVGEFVMIRAALERRKPAGPPPIPRVLPFASGNR